MNPFPLWHDRPRLGPAPLHRWRVRRSRVWRLVAWINRIMDNPR